MTRRQVVGFSVVVALLVAAFVVQALRSTSPAEEASGLVGLRAAAALEPCPDGLGKGLPELTLPCLGGGPDVRVQGDGPGLPLLVNAWATWCGPCRREVPELVQVALRGRGKLGVVGVHTQEVADKGLSFAKDAGMRYPSLVDEDGAFFRTYSSGPPVTVFVRPDGSVAHVERGEIESLDEVLALVRTHLGVSL